MSRPLWVGVPLGALACGPASLDAVPIRGATTAQQEAARTELVAFDAWIGAGRLSLGKVVFRELPRDIAGRFAHGPARVELSRHLTPDRVRDTLRHELCHALADAEALGGDEVAVLDAEVPGLFAMHARAGHGPRGGPIALRSEVLAEFCDQGPWAAQLISTGCDPAVADLGAWLVDEVWTHAPPLALTSDRVAVRVDVTLDGGAFDVRPTQRSTVVNVATSVGRGGSFDLYAGAPLAPEPAVAEERVAGPLVPGLTAIDTARAGVWSSGVVTADLAHLGSSSPRWVFHDGERWSALERCGDDRPATFSADGQVWAAWAESDAPSWVSLTAW